MNEWPVRAGGMDHGSAKGTKHSQHVNGALPAHGRNEFALTPTLAIEECVALHLDSTRWEREARVAQLERNAR
jgi:hypothetical protein